MSRQGRRGGQGRLAESQTSLGCLGIPPLQEVLVHKQESLPGASQGALGQKQEGKCQGWTPYPNSPGGHEGSCFKRRRPLLATERPLSGKCSVFPDTLLALLSPKNPGIDLAEKEITKKRK